ncbi:MAG: 3-keto-disaccharide hydrolase [Akkermansiaceae bacterium]
MNIFPVSRLLSIFAILSLGSSSADEKRVSLFNGKDLDGWTVLTCEAEVKDSNLFIKGGNGLIQSAKKYQDFVLEYEWKALGEDKWDSGVYFRYTSVPEKRPWPKRYQANLLKGQEGNVGGIKEATSKGMIKEGDWNKFKLTVQGSKISLMINDKKAWEADGLEDLAPGFIAFQAEVPGGGQHYFRKIFITELSK